MSGNMEIEHFPTAAGVRTSASKKATAREEEEGGPPSLRHANYWHPALYYYSGIRIFASDGFKHQNLMNGFYFSYILRF